MRRRMIAGNWKLHKTNTEAVRLAKQVKVLVADDARTVEVVLCPPFTSLYSVGDVLKGSGIALGAQNVAWADEGAYTGEVSAAMLKDVGCQYTIVGHSERRSYFSETDDHVRKKVEAAFERGLGVIACVGETEEQREQQLTEEIVQGQVRAIVDDLTVDDPARFVIAYEPIWAIGTGVTASSEEAGRMCALIRDYISASLGADRAERTRILYGGSVNPDNITDLLRQSDVDGALVGGASLEASMFAQIVKG